MFKDRVYAISSNNPSLPVNSKDQWKAINIRMAREMLHLDQRVIALNWAILINGAIYPELYHQNFHFHRIKYAIWLSERPHGLLKNYDIALQRRNAINKIELLPRLPVVACRMPHGALSYVNERRCTWARNAGKYTHMYAMMISCIRDSHSNVSNSSA